MQSFIEHFVCIMGAFSLLLNSLCSNSGQQSALTYAGMWSCVTETFWRRERVGWWKGNALGQVLAECFTATLPLLPGLGCILQSVEKMFWGPCLLFTTQIAELKRLSSPASHSLSLNHLIDVPCMSKRRSENRPGEVFPRNTLLQ